jgi:hypothetical protein
MEAGRRECDRRGQIQMPDRIELLKRCIEIALAIRHA